VKRREFITLLGGAAASWPQTATSQNTGRVHRVGVLFAASGRGSVPDEAFRSGLRERGYIEGKNIVIEKADRLRGLEVHCQSKRRGLLDRQVADLLAAQDLSQLSGQLTEHLGKVWTIADQSALLSKLRRLVDGWYAQRLRALEDVETPRIE
jgi:hypothetical protein